MKDLSDIFLRANQECQETVQQRLNDLARNPNLQEWYQWVILSVMTWYHNPFDMEEGAGCLYLRGEEFRLPPEIDYYEFYQLFKKECGKIGLIVEWRCRAISITRSNLRDVLSKMQIKQPSQPYR